MNYLQFAFFGSLVTRDILGLSNHHEYGGGQESHKFAYLTKKEILFQALHVLFLLLFLYISRPLSSFLGRKINRFIAARTT